MHHIGDEQWCGVTSDPSQAGKFRSGRDLEGSFYYCGRMRGGPDAYLQSSYHSSVIHSSVIPVCTKLKPSGDVIGMLVDLSECFVSFDLNGEFIGRDPIPQEPMWVLTHVDTPRDKVELRKLSVTDAPARSRQVPLKPSEPSEPFFLRAMSANRGLMPSWPTEG